MTRTVPPFVDASWLQAHRDEVVLVEVADERTVPGSVLVDRETDLSGPAGPTTGRHPLPSPEAFAAALTRLGIGDDDTVVALDDAGGVMAARLVWMLRATGRRAALLDGRLERWQPGPTRDVVPATARPWPQDLLADADDALDRSNAVLDARPHERYLGAPDPLDPRPGHVPGARSVPCRDNVGADGRLLPDDVLRERFAQAGADGSRPVVVYCGSGVTACHDALVLERLGLGPARVYVGSWSQYAADPARPVELGTTG